MTQAQRGCICDEHLYLTEEGVLCVRPGAFGPRLTLRFTSSGQFRKVSHLWLARVVVSVVGAGGAGGAAQATAAGSCAAGGGGGGGGFARSVLDVASLADSESVTVGTGGVGSASTAGGDGGFSAFGGHVVASGGHGGGLGTTTPNAFLLLDSSGFTGNPGRGTAGQQLRFGGSGDFGLAMGDTAELARGGYGGGSYLAGKRSAQKNGPGLHGQVNTGQGGAGGASHGDDPAAAGGTGGSGLVIVELYG